MADFADFADANYSALVRFAYLVTQDHALAQDLVQDALVKSFKRWSKIRLIEYPGAYIRRIIINDYSSWRRRIGNKEMVGVVPDLTYSDNGIENVGDRDELWELMGQRLSRRERIVLVLRYYEDRPDEEIASILDCRRSTVRSLAARGIKSLQAIESRPVGSGH